MFFGGGWVSTKTPTFQGKIEAPNSIPFSREITGRPSHFPSVFCSNGFAFGKVQFRALRVVHD
jgi:hypothetical protein